jgi:hypothetical protein
MSDNEEEKRVKAREAAGSTNENTHLKALETSPPTPFCEI